MERSSNDPGLIDLISSCPLPASVSSHLDKMPAFLWATDISLRFTSLNGAGLRATNLCVSNFLGKSVDALFRGAKPSEKALQAHRDALQGHAGAFDVELNGRDLEAQVEALRDPDGSIAGVIGVALDVTGRAVAERALRL